MKIVVISPSTKSLQDMSLMLEQGNQSRVVRCHEGGISRLRTLAEEERPDVIIVEGLCRDAGELAPIEFVTNNYPQVIVIMLCSQQTPEFLIHAMRVGVREVLPSPVAKVALESAVVRAEMKLGLRDKAQHNARILAFVSAKGGAGATFLATNLGYQLSTENKKVLLIDLNLQCGEAVLTVHDRKATSDIAEVARNLSRLDASFLSSSTVPVSANFEILAAPDDPAQSLQIKPEHLEGILGVAVNNYDFILLDLSRNLDDLMIKALDRAHNVFLIVQAMLPYVRNAKQMLSVFNSLGYTGEKVQLLINRYLKSGEIGLDDLRSTLGTNRMHVIPNSYNDIAKAINQGRPLAAVSRSNPVVKAINELAETLLPKTEQAQGGLLKRLLKY
jgi:pilus assembly protein CpaE